MRAASQLLPGLATDPDRDADLHRPRRRAVAALSLHMLQHLLIADLPAPLLLYGVRAPVALLLLADARCWSPPRACGRCAGSGRGCAQPQDRAHRLAGHAVRVAHPVLLRGRAHQSARARPGAHHALRSPACSHGGRCMDPTHHRVEGRIWKAGYIVAARMIGGVLGIAADRLARADLPALRRRQLSRTACPARRPADRRRHDDDRRLGDRDRRR